MKRIGLFIAVTAAGLALVACVPGAPREPSAEPDIRGVVTDVSGSGESVSMRVVWTDDSTVGAQAGYDAAQVTASADTKWMLRAADGSVTAAEASDVAVGTVAEAWFTGAVLESYPVQATAQTIVIAGTYSGELPEPPGLGQ